MSESDQFRQFAEEALLWAAQSKNEEEKQLLLELAHTWTRAAVASDALVNHHTGPLPAAMPGIPDARSHAAA
jgi:hypothetical protein